MPFLRRYLDDEHKDKEKLGFQGVEDCDILPLPCEVPQQQNGYDCGVFSCCFVHYFSQQPTCVLTRMTCQRCVCKLLHVSSKRRKTSPTAVLVSLNLGQKFFLQVRL